MIIFFKFKKKAIQTTMAICRQPFLMPGNVAMLLEEFWPSFHCRIFLFEPHWRLFVDEWPVKVHTTVS